MINLILGLKKWNFYSFFVLGYFIKFYSFLFCSIFGKRLISSYPVGPFFNNIFQQYFHSLTLSYLIQSFLIPSHLFTHFVCSTVSTFFLYPLTVKEWRKYLLRGPLPPSLQPMVMIESEDHSTMNWEQHGYSDEGATWLRASASKLFSISLTSDLYKTGHLWWAN